MKKILLVLCLTVISYAQMSLSNPQPSFENPRKWVIRLNVSDEKTVNSTLGTIYNVLKEYPSEGLKVAVVAYGKGVKVLRKDYDKHTLTRISSLMDYEVEFVVCKNTMESMHWTKDDLIDDLLYVQAGIAEVIERQVDGYYEVTPY
jgi:intracellular sulfur oxidation DsrE/DsrF family protein